MAVDNLPCELPRDASDSFGKHLRERILPAFFNNDPHGLLARATIAADGQLQKDYLYLKEYVEREE
jgi:hypothetical protein